MKFKFLVGRMQWIIFIIAIVLVGVGAVLKYGTPFSSNYQGNLSYEGDQAGSYVLPIALTSSVDQSAIKVLVQPGNERQYAGSTQEQLLPAVDENGIEGTATSQIPSAPPIQCKSPQQTLILDNGNIVIRNVRWRIKSGQTGVPNQIGCGTAAPNKKQTGHFWFKNSEALDLSCKALSNLTGNTFYSIFCGSLTDTEWWIEVINNGNPTIKKTYYSAPGKPIAFAEKTALAVGPNNVPVFDPQYCGGTFEIPLGASGTISAYVRDPQGDNLTANARILEGDNRLQFTPQWTNPVAGTGLFLQNALYFPAEPGEYLFGIEVNDGKTLVSPVCTYRFKVR